MDRKFNLTPIKNYSPTLKAGLIYLLSLLACMILLDIFGNKIMVNIPVNVQEMGDAGAGLAFPFQVQSLLKIFLLSLCHGTISYIVFKDLLQQYHKSQIALNQPVSALKLRTLEIILLWIIVTLMMGHVIHWLCDRANYLYRGGTEEYPTDEAFLIVYYADEYLSHAIIHISYLLLLVFGAYCELGIQPRRKMNPDELFIIGVMAVGVVVVNGEAARVGESAFPLVILSGIVMIGILILKFAKKISLMEYPLLSTVLLGSIGVVIYDLGYYFIVGGLPYYPFIT